MSLQFYVSLVISFCLTKIKIEVLDHRRKNRKNYI